MNSKLMVPKSEHFSCYTESHARYLCETLASNSWVVDNTTAHIIKFPEPPAMPLDIHSVRTASCPEGHVIHEFLACDAQSSCWARVDVLCQASRDDDSVAFCGAALTPLPPSFPCSNGRGEVPYTLVCDHRPDCSDSSDEKFCVFLPCDVMTQFDCGNQQVRFVGDLGTRVGGGGEGRSGGCMCAAVVVLLLS